MFNARHHALMLVICPTRHSTQQTHALSASGFDTTAKARELRRIWGFAD